MSIIFVAIGENPIAISRTKGGKNNENATT
jgi:hypothetical protein